MLVRCVRAAVFAAALLSLSAFAANPPAVLETTPLATDDPLALDIPAGSRLEIKGMWGDLEIVRGDGPQTTIEIARPVAGAEPRLVLLRHEEGYTLCAIHTSPNPKRPNECVPGRKGRMDQGNRKDWPRLNFTVRVPDGVPVMGMMFGGRIAARAGANDLDLDLRQGEIVIHDAGSKTIDGKVYGGNIQAVLADAAMPEPRRLRLSSMGGNIDVEIPPSLPVDYRLYADQAIRGDFAVAEKFAGAQEGRLGPDGDAALVMNLDTAVLGKITLRKKK